MSSIKKVMSILGRPIDTKKNISDEIERIAREVGLSAKDLANATNASIAAQMQTAQAQQNQWGSQLSGIGSPAGALGGAQVPRPRPTISCNAKLMMRLDRTEYGVPFQYLNCVATPEGVHVFIVKDNKPITITDDQGLFPSDRLVTQIRMLME